jgi:hypothetical protein
MVDFFAHVVVAFFVFVLFIYSGLGLWMVYYIISMLLVNGELPLAKFVQRYLDKRQDEQIRKIGSPLLKFRVAQIRESPFEEYLTKYISVKKEIRQYSEL